MDVRSLRTPVAAYLASRATVLVAMWFADIALPDRRLLDLGKSWDGAYYYEIAAHGYPHQMPVVAGHVAKSTLGFFPLFPMTSRVLALLPGVGTLDAAVGISLVCGLVATLLVWRLADLVWDRPTADRAAVLFAFFPGSFVFSIAYSEGLAVALCAGCLLLLHRQRWLLAGVAAALATATRPSALALVPACAVAAFLAIRSERRWTALAAPALAPLGFVGFHVFLRLRTGHWDAYTRTQSEGWGQDVSPFAVPRTVASFLAHPFADVNVTLSMAGAMLGVAGFVLLLRVRPPAALLVFSAGILLVSLSSEALGVKPRFLLTAFPLIYGLARVLRREALGIAVGTEATILGTLTFVCLATIFATP